MKSCVLSFFVWPRRRPSSLPPPAASPSRPVDPCTGPVPLRAAVRSLRPGLHRWWCPPRSPRGNGWWMWHPRGTSPGGSGSCPRRLPPEGTLRQCTGGSVPRDGPRRTLRVPHHPGRVRVPIPYGRCHGGGTPRVRSRGRSPGRRGAARRSTRVWCAGWRPAGSARTWCSCATGRTDVDRAGPGLAARVALDGAPRAPALVRHASRISVPADCSRAAATIRAAAAASCTATPTDL